MKPGKQTRRCQRGHSLLELVFVVAIIALLASMILPVLQGARAKSLRARCTNNLRQIGIAFYSWANDHNERFPMSVPVQAGGSAEFAQPGPSLTLFRHFQLLSNELVDPRVLVCPADRRVAAPSFGWLMNTNISYGLNTRAEFGKVDSILAADRNLRTSGRMEFEYMQFGPGDLVEWSSTQHGFRGNVLFGDSHVDSLTMQAAGRLTNGGDVVLIVPQWPTVDPPISVPPVTGPVVVTPTSPDPVIKPPTPIDPVPTGPISFPPTTPGPLVPGYPITPAPVAPHPVITNPIVTIPVSTNPVLTNQTSGPVVSTPGPTNGLNPANNRGGASTPGVVILGGRPDSGRVRSPSGGATLAEVMLSPDVAPPPTGTGDDSLPKSAEADASRPAIFVDSSAAARLPARPDLQLLMASEFANPTNLDEARVTTNHTTSPTLALAPAGTDSESWSGIVGKWLGRYGIPFTLGLLALLIAIIAAIEFERRRRSRNRAE